MKVVYYAGKAQVCIGTGPPWVTDSFGEEQTITMPEPFQYYVGPPISLADKAAVDKAIADYMRRLEEI